MMAEEAMLSKPLTSLNEINKTLQAINKLNRDELDKNAFKCLLSGFRVIVNCLESDISEINLEVAIEWMRLYLKVHIIISSSDTKLTSFLKSVPIAITYIIGWLHNAPPNDIHFYTEVLNMSFKLVYLADKRFLKQLESDDGGVILLLWNVIDRVKQFNIQMKVLELFILILENLDKNFAFREVKNIPNVKSSELYYNILDLLKTRKDEYLFKKLARSILNLRNSQENIDGGVQSFYCKKLDIGKSFKFLKPTYSDRFWFDMNQNPHTLTFEGRIAPKSSRKYQNVDVSLKIKEIIVDNNYLVIKFTPPVELSGLELKSSELNEVDIARFSLSKTELNRFVNLFNVLRKTKNDSPSTKQKSYINSNFSGRYEISIDSNGSLIRETTTQIQQLKPLSPICNNDVLSKEFKSNGSIMLDEYENIDVSDAEPCQSYKNFTKRKCATTRINGTWPPKEPLKRSFKAADSTDNYSKPKKIHKEFDVWDFGPSTSKMAKERFGSTNYYSSLPENEFETLKNNTIPEKTLYSLKDNIVDLTNNSSYLLTDKSNTKSIDLTLNSKENKIDSLNPKSSEKINYLELPTLISTTKNVLKTSTFGTSQVTVPFEETRDDCLLYQKRSDNDSSSDNSDFKKHSTPKRKLSNTNRSTAKKRFFDLTPNITLRKKKDQSPSIKKPYISSKFSRRYETSDDSSDSLIRKTTKQIQQVKPLSPIFNNDVLSKELKSNGSIMLNENENNDVSDAEPCQSYKNFTKRKCATTRINGTWPPKEPLKRSFKATDSIDEYSKPKKIHKEFDVWDFGPSTSKMAKGRFGSTNYYSSLPENKFEKLKNNTVSEKSAFSLKDNVIDLANNSSYLLTEKSNTKSIDLTLNSKENKIDSLNLKSSEKINYLELPTLISTKKNLVNALSACETSQVTVPFEETRDDCLWYQKRLDDDSSSDNSDFQAHGTPKRKLSNTNRSTAKKSLFDLSRANILDADSDYDVTEFIYIAAAVKKTNTSFPTSF